LEHAHDYSGYHLRAEIFRQLCGLPEYDLPPVSRVSKPAPPPPDHRPFVTEPIPILGKELIVQTYCKAPQCNRYMHIANDKECFKFCHSPDYPYKHQRLLQ